MRHGQEKNDIETATVAVGVLAVCLVLAILFIKSSEIRQIRKETKQITSLYQPYYEMITGRY